MVDTINGQPIYGHRGFWGTAAWYSPTHRTVAAGVTLNKDCFAELLPIIQGAAAEAGRKAS
jgi:D-alanyl-D-alanine carboxypeptidase